MRPSLYEKSKLDWMSELICMDRDNLTERRAECPRSRLYVPNI